jgi:hypothetical protein
MNRKRILVSIAVIGSLAAFTLAAGAQGDSGNSDSEPDSKATSSLASLPIDRSLRLDGGLSLDGVDTLQDHPSPTQDRSEPNVSSDRPVDFKSLLMPRFDFSAEREPRADGFAISSYDFSVQMPIYPIYGPPPPFIMAGYTFTQIDAPATIDLPQDLHEFSIGMAWMRKINDNWMARLTLNGVFASDLNNNSSDAWQVRAGGFAIYRPNKQWSFAFGALATGRDDIPVIPAIGAIWEPSPELRVNLMLPNPKIAFLLADSGTRQHWGYFGGGISGGTWAFDRSSGLSDRLSYHEWRLVLGWESRSPQLPGTFRPIGTTFNVEAGYVFGREFEFDSASPDISIDDALLLRMGIKF